MIKLWKLYCDATKYILYAGLAIACVCIAFLSLLVGVEVIGRNFFNVSTMIVDEYAGYFCAGLTFFGAAYAFERGSFINVDLLYAHFKGTLKRVADFLILLFALLFLAAFLYYSIHLVAQSIRGGVVSTYISRTPLAIPQMAMPIGIGMLILQIIKDIGNQVFQKAGEQQ